MADESFVVLATLKAVDLISGVIEKVSGSFGKMSESAQAAATAAEEAGAKIDSSLLQTASGLDAMDLAAARAQASREQLAVASETQANAERELMAAQQEAAASADGDISAQARLIEASNNLAAAQRKTVIAAKEAEAAQAHLAATVDAAAGVTVAASEEEGLAAEKAAVKTKGASDASSGASARAKNAAFLAAAAIAGIGYESVKSAMSFQTLTTRLVTTAGESKSQLDLVRQGILAISTQTGITADDLAKAMYVIESGGYHGQEGLDVLRAAEEGAATEGADFSNVANAVSNILRAYSLHGQDAANITSQLTAAVSLGKATFQTMSTAMGTVLPVASSMHLKFNDVAGTLAEMTAQGIPALRASQNLANALRSLEKPSATMIKEFKAVGITTADLNNHLATQGLGGTLQWLSTVAAANASKLHQTYGGALGALMGTAAGLNVALTTTGKHANETANNIATIGKTTADAHGRVQGFADVQRTAAFQMKVLEVSVKDTGIAIGTALLPLVTRLAADISKVVAPIAAWVQKHQQLTKMIFEFAGALLAVFGVLKLVAMGTDLVRGAMLLLSESPVIAAITAIILVLVYCYTHFKTFRDIVNAAVKGVVIAVEATWHALDVAFKAIAAAAVWVWHALQTAWNAMATVAFITWHALQTAWNGVVGAAKAVWKFLVDIWNSIVSVTTSVWNGISAFFSKWWPLLLTIFAAPIALLISLWNHTHQMIFDAARAVWGAIAGFFSATWHAITAVAQIAWNLIYQYIVQPMELVWHMLVSVWNSINSAISSAVHWVMGYLMQAWNLIYQYIVHPLEQAWGMVVNIFGDITHAITSAINGVLGWLSGIGSWFVSIGSDIVNGIISGIESAGSALFSTLGNLAQSALNAAKSFLGIGSPSKLFADEVGRWIPEGVAKGVTDSAHIAHRAVNTMASGLLGGAGTTSIGAGFSIGAGIGGAAAGGGISIHVHAEGSTLMSDQDMDKFIQKIEQRLTRVTLPAGGVRFRF